MTRRKRPRSSARRAIVLAALLGICAVALLLPTGANAIVAGAGYSTSLSNATCIHGTVINCNAYALKTDVYVSGGPTAGGIKTAGDYYFAILDPSAQNGGAADGASGNLSSVDSGCAIGDTAADRKFHVSIDGGGNPVIDTNLGTHSSDTNSAGKFVIQAAPFCDTSNQGGVYILAICKWGSAAASDCKFDAFKVEESVQCPEPPCVVTPFGVVSGEKYYDANLDGQLGQNEVGIAGWKIDWSDTASGTLTTDSSGNFSASFSADTYNFQEEQPTNQKCVTEIINNVSTLVCSQVWFQTGNTVNQTQDTAPNVTNSLVNYIYNITVADGGSTSGVNFGNVCVGAGGGLTLGYWSNKNGQAAQFSSAKAAATLAFLDSLNLRNANGSNFDPTTYAAFRTWLLSASATNMAYMLSAQLSAMELNVRNGNVLGTSLIYAPGTNSANSLGFATVNAVMAEANTELGLHGLTLSGSPYRSYQEALKNALDRANNNLNFVQSGPGSCPAPTF